MFPLYLIVLYLITVLNNGIKGVNQFILLNFNQTEFLSNNTQYI